MDKVVKRLSPSMGVACIALLVALGGVAFAATSLPANSVGAVQLMANAVNSAKVKDGTLLQADFHAGQLRAGAQGPRGLAGPTGPKGDKGATGSKGPAGAPGPSNGYVDTTIGPTRLSVTSPTRVATLRLPDPGSYVIWSKAYLEASGGGSNPTEFVCLLTANGDSDGAKGSAPTGYPETLVNVLTETVTTATTVNLSCDGNVPGTASQATITAIKVAALTTTSG